MSERTGLEVVLRMINDFARADQLLALNILKVNHWADYQEVACSHSILSVV